MSSWNQAAVCAKCNTHPLCCDLCGAEQPDDSVENDKALAQRIAEMGSSVDTDPAIPVGDREWKKGYKQACSDIITALSRS